MKIKKDDLIMQNKVFLWVAATTGLILLIPLIATQISNNWDWKLLDFIVIGTLILSMGIMFVYVARMTPRKHRLLIGLGFLAVTIYIWAELAVGIFMN